MPHLNANGVELHYETDSEGYPLVFVHGGFGGVSTSVLPGGSPIEGAVPDGYCVVTHDRRCAGTSEYTLDWFTLADIDEDTHQLMVALGFENYVLVGSSMGGMVAQQLVLTRPGAIAALALMNTGPDLMSHTRWGQAYTATAARVRETGDDLEFERVRDRIRNPPEPDADAAKARHAEYLTALAARSDDELKLMHSGTVRNYGAFVGYNFSGRLSEIDAPTLIVHGTADTTVPFEDGQTLERGIRGSEFHAIEGAQHGILGYPAAKAALQGWLSRLSLSR